jgi:proline iminopeptidase
VGAAAVAAAGAFNVAPVLSMLTAIAVHAQCPDGSPPPCRTVRPAPPPRSVAVLYLDNLSRDSNDLYLADGITEEIISRLGQVARLAVKSRYAVRRFRGHTDQDPAALGRALGVMHLVTGSVERAGPRTRVRVELVAATSGRHMWGQTFDRPDGDALAIEDDIAQAVAHEVIGRLASSERIALTARPTRDPQAYDHYLRGNFYLSRRTSQADGRRALEEYQAALRLDPAFPSALGRLGLVYGIYASWPWPYAGLTHDSLIALGLAAANRAIALDSASADGWLARGFLFVPAPTTPDGWRGFALNPALNAAELTCSLPASECVRQARNALAHALELDPRNAEIWYQYGRTFFLDDRVGTGDSAFERSLTLDPDRAVTAWILGWAYLIHHRFAESLRMLDSAIALGRHDLSVHSLRLQAKLALGDGAGARTELEVVGRLLGERPPDDSIADVFSRSMRVLVEAQSGDSTAARSGLDTLLGRYPPESIEVGTMLVNLAAALVAVGAFDRGLAVLERVPPSQLRLSIQNPLWDPVRQDPRFRHIAVEVRAIEPALDRQRGLSPGEGYVQVPGGRVWYRIVGSGTRTPILVLHGGGVPSTYLKPLAALADERPVVFYEQLGAGRSDHPTDTTLWHMERFLEELDRVRQALGLEEVHLYGHSWGTILAVEYMLTRPAGVRSLILAGPVLNTARFRHDNDSLVSLLPDSIASAIRRHENAGTTDSPEYQAARLEYLKRFYARRQPWSADLDSAVGHQDRSASRAMRDYLRAYDRTDRLTEITTPTLFVVGRYDNATPATARFYQSRLPGSELEIFDDSGHLPMQDEPDRYVQVIREFLRRVEAR